MGSVDNPLPDHTGAGTPYRAVLSPGRVSRAGEPPVLPRRVPGGAEALDEERKEECEVKCGTTHYVGCACHEASRDAEIHDLKATRTIFRRTLERIRDWCRYQGEWRDLKPEGIAALIETAKLLSEAERKAAGKPTTH